MIFNVYHEVSEQIIHYLTHKTTDREISGNMVRCRYKGHELTFLPTSSTFLSDML